MERGEQIMKKQQTKIDVYKRQSIARSSTIAKCIKAETSIICKYKQKANDQFGRGLTVNVDVVFRNIRI